MGKSVLALAVLAVISAILFSISFRNLLVLLVNDTHLVSGAPRTKEGDSATEHRATLQPNAGIALVTVGTTFGALLGALIFVGWRSLRWDSQQALGETIPNQKPEEDRFRQLADAMPQIVWTARSDGHVEYFNQRWYELTGSPKGEGDASWLPILHPEDRQRCLDTWYESVRTGRPYQIEYRFQNQQTGDYRWHLGRALPIRNANGQIILWIGTSTDIDLQTRAIVELRHAGQTLEDRVAERTAELTATNETLRQEVAHRQMVEQRLQLQYTVAQVLARSTSLTEGIDEVLKAIRETSGWDIVEYWQHDSKVNGVRCLAISPGPTPALEEFARQSRSLVFDSAVGLPYQVWQSRKTTWVESFAGDRTLFRGQKAQAAGLTSGLGFPVLSGFSVVGVLTFFGAQITKPDADVIALLTGIAGQIGQFIDRKRATMALKEATERLQAVLDAATEVAVVATTPEGVITVFNVGAERMLGYSAEEMVGKQTPVAFHCVDEAQRRGLELSLELGVPVNGFESFVNQARRGLPEQQEWTYIRKNGTRWTGSLVVTAQRDSAGEVIGFLGIAKDISARKEADKALAKAKESAESANRAKGVFLAHVSHEIRTPLNGILGMANLILDTEVTPIQRDYLTSLHLSAECLLSLINDILDLSKIEAGKLELDEEPFDLRDGIADTLWPLALGAHEKGLEVACRIATEVPDGLLGDLGRLRQILINLLGNAIKFTRQGEVVLDVRLEESIGDEVVLCFRIKDTGIGIAPEKRESIFTPFEQADGSTTRNYGGTGLGLTISARLAQLLGGSIRVESEPARGSTFSVSVRMTVRTPPPIVVEHGLQGHRVLVIEDNATQRGILLEILGAWQMEAVAVGGIEQAIVAMQRTIPAFECIILDSTLPGDEAISFAQQVRRNVHGANVPLIVLTAEGAEHPPHWADLNLEATLSKPIRQSQLLEALREVLAVQLVPVVAASPLNTSRKPEPARSALRILLAEDNKINQVVIEHTLRKEGYEVVVTENGREAVDAVSRETFDLVLMDVAMPEMDGLEATRLLRESERGTERHLPIIALTANVMKNDREMCLAAGMDAYVGKPFQIADLHNAIRSVATRSPVSPRKPVATKSSQASLPILDVGGLLSRIEGNRNLLKTLRQLFQIEGPRQLAAVREALEKGDAVAVERSAHMLKGAVALLSSPRAAEAARSLEMMGKDRNLVGAEVAFAKLERAVRDLEQALNSMDAPETARGEGQIRVD